MKKLCALLLISLAMGYGSNQELLKQDMSVIREVVLREAFAVEVPDFTVYSVEDTSMNGVPVRIYLPSNASNLPTALFIHGGGWVLGSIESHDNLCRYLCQHSKVRIVSVDYSLAPEAKFPRGLEECYSVLQHLSEETDDLSVIGDSAGANMTAALSLMARDRGGPTIRQQILINPCPDIRPGVKLCEAKEDSDWCISMYLNRAEEVYHPYASPAAAKDHSNLPPTLILVADQDVLYQSGLEYARLIGAKTYTQKGIGHLGTFGARAEQRAHESLEVAARALGEGVENID